MVAQLVAVGAGLAAGGLAGSIFGRKKIPSYDVRGIINQINQGGEEQRRIISQGRPETEAQLTRFQTGVDTAQAGAKTARETERARYLSELDPVTSRLLQAQTDQLKRTTFGAIPEAQQATREALAASGGLNRGVSAESLARVPLQAAQQFSEGAADLQQQALQTQQQALANLHSEESQAIAKDLGIDQDTYNTVLNTGNQALINELNALIEESRTRTAGLVGAEQFRQTGNVASASADEANRQAVFQSLTGLGGTLAGLGTKSNLPAGVEEVEQVKGKRSKKSAVMSSFDRSDIG